MTYKFGIVGGSSQLGDFQRQLLVRTSDVWTPDVSQIRLFTDGN